MKDRVKMEDDSKAKIQIDAEQHPEQKKAGSVFSVIAEAFYITKPNLCLYFGVILIALQLPDVDFAKAIIQFKHEWGLKSHVQSLGEIGHSGRVSAAFAVNCALHLKSLYALSFQIIVLVFIKHYSNRLNQIETRQAIKES